MDASNRLRNRETLTERLRSKQGPSRLKAQQEPRQELYQSKNGVGGISFDNLQDAFKRSYQTVFSSSE